MLSSSSRPPIGWFEITQSSIIKPCIIAPFLSSSGSPAAQAQARPPSPTSSSSASAPTGSPTSPMTPITKTCAPSLQTERVTINFDHPNSLDTPLLIQHVRQLRDGLPVDLPVYDFKNHTRTDQTERIEPRPVIMVEGILIFGDPDLRKLLDVKIFVDTNSDIRFIRRLERDIAERGRTTEMVVRQYLSTVRPMHLEFVEPSKRYADVIVPEGGLNTVAMEMVAARLEALLEEDAPEHPPIP